MERIDSFHDGAEKFSTKFCEDTKNLSEKPCTSIILNIRGIPSNFVRGFWKGLWLHQLEQDEQDNAADMCEHGQGSSEMHYPLSPILKFKYAETISRGITYL